MMEQNMFEKHKFKQNCKKIISLWNITVREMKFDDYALVMLTEFIRKQRDLNKSASTLKRNTACATYLIIGAIKINTFISDPEYKGRVLAKLILILEYCFDFHNIKDRVLSRAFFLDRVRRNESEESMIDEALLILKYDYCNTDLVEYKEDTPLMLLDFNDDMVISIEGRATISTILDLVTVSARDFNS